MKPVDAPSFVYRGGKGRIRRWLVRLMPSDGRAYVEPFCGRANVYLLQCLVSSFQEWRLNDTQTVPFLKSVTSYDGSRLCFDDWTVNDFPLFMEPLVLWAGGISGKSSWTGHRGHNMVRYRRNLLRAKLLLGRAVFSDMGAVSMLEKADLGEADFVYLDPPYLGANVGTYSDDMLDYGGLFQLLKGARYRWMFSHYPHPRIIEELGEPTSLYHNIFVSPRTGHQRREVEGVWTNYKQSPRAIDFEDSEKPLVGSIRIFRERGELTFDEFARLAPKQWEENTKKMQFSRLCCLPHAYYDGRSVRWIGSREGSLGVIGRIWRKDLDATGKDEK